MSAPRGLPWSEYKRRECCSRKARHASWEDARLAGLAVWLENPRDRYANPPTPYPCAVLGESHYHCGHMRVRLNRRRAAA